MEPIATFELITIEIAKEFLQKNKCNRPINEYNVAFLENEIRRGTFFLTGEPIIISNKGNLLDAQHRLLAIVRTGIPQTMLVVRGIDQEAFKYMGTGKVRSAGDVLGVQKIANPYALSAMGRFIILFKNGNYQGVAGELSTRKLRLTNNDIYTFVTDNLPSLNESYKYGFVKENKLIAASILASLHFILKKINHSQANDFCNKIATGNDLKGGDVIMILRNRFIDNSKSSQKMNPLEKVALICKAWNIYRNGERVTNLKWYPKSEEFPIPI